ncbi:hypothetical protein GCM10010512_13650 [Streptomyces thermoviolaceus subsp. thermoviolaceus]|nr:hypothetical protein GCM10010512_13650 [Streptomyces thermoviolaceus subsp. thermoviolaceus]
MPAAAHSAGSSTRRADAADAENDAAEDGAHPKDTFLPSATRPHGGRDRMRQRPAAQSDRITGPSVRERLRAFLSHR